MCSQDESLTGMGRQPRAEGYYRYPTLHGETLAFVCEDQLWCARPAQPLPARRPGFRRLSRGFAARRSVPLSGGIPRRLSDTPGLLSHPRFSPNGEWIAFTVKHQGSCEEVRCP